MKCSHVLILEGGRSVEYEVSLRSSLGIQYALRSSGFSVGVIRIERDGSWSDVGGDWPSANRKFVLSADPHMYTSVSDNLVVFPVLHGPYGEDGTIQGLLELANIPYVGCGVLASALGMHKGCQKELFVNHGLQVSPWISVKKSKWESNQEEMIEKVTLFLKQQYPFFVKPIRTGSSVGISKVSDKKTLKIAIELSLQYDDEVIIEQGVNPLREIEVAVLGTTAPEASVIGEIIPDGEFYDYESKYGPESKTKLSIDPSDISKKIKNEIRSQAVRAFTILGGSGLSRVDFFLSGNRIIINEINTLPGFTTISMYPKLWEASGISFSDLCTRLVTFGKEAWQSKQLIKTTV
ncbi:MAG: D-alanine--D-alanine ligase family protein [Candidatus Gottesmanbacteria bacterium]